MSVRGPSSTTVLITGAAGFLGSHLCDYFLKRDWHVIGIDNLLTGVATNLAHLASDTRFRFLRHDVTKPFVVDDPIDLVLHFACPASPRDYLRHPIHTLKVDSVGTLHTLGIAKAHRATYTVTAGRRGASASLTISSTASTGSPSMTHWRAKCSTSAIPTKSPFLSWPKWSPRSSGPRWTSSTCRCPRMILRVGGRTP